MVSRYASTLFKFSRINATIITRWGVVSYADSLDCVGVFAKTCASAKQVFGKYNLEVQSV